MKKLLNLIALGLVSALLVGCMRDGKDGNPGTNGSHGLPGKNGDNGQNAPAAGATAAGAGAGAAVVPVVTVPTYAGLIADLKNSKTLSLVIGPGAADTAGGVTVGDQGLAPNAAISFDASANGRTLVSINHPAGAANLNDAAHIQYPTVGNFGAAFPHADTPAIAHNVNALGNMIAVRLNTGAGAAPVNGDHTYIMGFSSRVVQNNGDITGTGLIMYVDSVDFSGANGYTPAPVPFTYTIN